MPRRNATEIFSPPRYGAAHGHVQEPTPGSAVEFWCARTNPWFRGRTLPVPGHGGGYLSRTPAPQAPLSPVPPTHEPPPRTPRNHLEERLLDQAQARALYTPLFGGPSNQAVAEW